MVDSVPIHLYHGDQAFLHYHEIRFNPPVFLTATHEHW
jgi:hypothetical protein